MKYRCPGMTCSCPDCTAEIISRSCLRTCPWIISNVSGGGSLAASVKRCSEIQSPSTSHHSNVDRHFSYSPIKIKYKDENYTGCISPNGLNEDEELITIYQLMSLSDSDFSRRINNDFDYASPKEYINEFVAESIILSELRDLNKYYTKMFELDAITLNNDRHMNNISLLMHDNGRVYYDYDPIFDNGNALALSHENVQKWKDGESVQNIIGPVEGKPFSTDFDTQRKIFENGDMKLMLYYGPEDLERSLNRCRNIYNDQVMQFADDVFMVQYNRYRDFFFDKNREKWKETMEREVGMESSENKHEIIFTIRDDKISVTPSGIMKLNGKEPENLFEVFNKGEDVFELYRKVNIVTDRLKDLPNEEQDKGLIQIDLKVYDIQDKKNETTRE